MRNRAEERCLPEQVSIEFIDNRVSLAIEGGYEVDTVFMSPDVYQAFITKMQNVRSITTYAPSTGIQVCRIMCSHTAVDVQITLDHVEFLFAGTKESYERETWARIDKAFEEEVLI